MLLVWKVFLSPDTPTNVKWFQAAACFSHKASRSTLVSQQHTPENVRYLITHTHTHTIYKPSSVWQTRLNTVNIQLCPDVYIHSSAWTSGFNCSVSRVNDCTATLKNKLDTVCISLRRFNKWCWRCCRRGLLWGVMTAEGSSLRHKKDLFGSIHQTDRSPRNSVKI